MGWFDDDSDERGHYESAANYDRDDYQKYEPSTAHELIAGAASYEAAKAWENHQAKNGKPSSHSKAKEILAGVAGAFIDREFESKGLDAIDGFEREHAKKKAEEQINYHLRREYE